MPRPQRRGKKGAKAKRHKPYPMTDVDTPGLEQFIATGRTGRRNAVPDIMDPVGRETSTGGLPYELEKLQCSDDGESSKSDTASAADKSDDSTSTKSQTDSKKS